MTIDLFCKLCYYNIMETKFMQKLISVIIPCYNAEKYINRCFDSIARQTIGLDCLEVILVDDCSTDRTWEKLTAIEAACPQSAVIIRCDEHGGMGAAKNIGLSYVSAPFVSFVEPFDWIAEDMYEKLYAKSSLNNCEIVICHIQRTDGIARNTPVREKAAAQEHLLVIDTEKQRRAFLADASADCGAYGKLYAHRFLTENTLYFPEASKFDEHFFVMLAYLYAQKVYVTEQDMYYRFEDPITTFSSLDCSHYFELLTVHSILWEEYGSRGFLDAYRQELEYHFLRLCYLGSMELICLYFTRFPYDFFCRLKRETLLRIPDWHSNVYIADTVSELQKMFLQMLDIEISEQDFIALCRSVRRIFLKDSITVYVMTHVSFEVPSDPAYIPLHVGRALHDDLGYPGDDTGENISHLNPYYSELTGLYWVWKNVCNIKYAGLCHYRRYFLTEHNLLMSKEDYVNILSRYDIILSQPVHSGKCYRDVYAEAHNIADLMAVGSAIAALYPDCPPFFEEALSGYDLYCGNLFVTTKQLFDEYAEWLFSIFELASKQIDTSSYDDYHRRVYGFLSEQLLFVWVRYRGLACYEAKIGFTQASQDGPIA